MRRLMRNALFQSWGCDKFTRQRPLSESKAGTTGKDQGMQLINHTTTRKRRRPQWRRIDCVVTRSLLLAPLLCGSSFVQPAAAKTITDEFQLSPSRMEAVLGAFCVSPRKRGHVSLQISLERNADTIQWGATTNANNDLTLGIYRDDNFTHWENALSCTDKENLALSRQALVATNTTTQQQQQQQQSSLFAPIDVAISNSKQNRAHYYYVVVLDCALLEEYPVMEYKLQLLNNGSHISADEQHLNIMHMVTLLFSGLIATLLALKVLIQFYEKSTIHAAVLGVMAAAASDSLASLLAIIHLQLYAHDGIGSPFLDALSCHLEATCDSLVALLLLSIGAGWTLPSDVVRMSSSSSSLYTNQSSNAAFVHKIIVRGLQSPLETFGSVVLTASIFFSHVLLAQWGLHYHNHDFDSYHDLEHLPGKLMMLLRGLLGICLWICCAHTKLVCPQSLASFYNQLALVGTLWFESLPLLTCIVNTAVSYHLRHRTIGVWGAFLQMISIALLGWLVTAHSSRYQRLSHISSTPHDSLTERLANSTTSSSSPAGGSRTWTMLGRAKVRLD